MSFSAERILLEEAPSDALGSRKEDNVDLPQLIHQQFSILYRHPPLLAAANDKFARGKAPFLAKQNAELDHSAPSHLHYPDLQTSLQPGHTQSCQGKAPGSHLLPAPVVLGKESALSR
ncbi:hypothetical protein SADUNF_Sadunf09G0054900 [Salix dunnii]|uniref:Uncharacterized protein n=1 Tax=Salix dunnii TaxID=1413687 RepID=A0A835JXQ9_9ROSI|nr:hypothetical protein SADUNF_Sadunf09G0054900 [Salix dunnii]